MENLLQNLSDTLDMMINTYNDIFQTAQEKKDHIISGDIDKLESVIYQERNFAESILLLEEKRRYILRTINQSMGNNNNSTKLDKLIEQIRDPYKSKLKEQYDIIVEIIMKVDEINKTNTSLTKYSLEYVNKFIKSMCSETLNDSTYQQSGKLKEDGLQTVLFETNA